MVLSWVVQACGLFWSQVLLWGKLRLRPTFWLVLYQAALGPTQRTLASETDIRWRRSMEDRSDSWPPKSGTKSHEENSFCPLRRMEARLNGIRVKWVRGRRQKNPWESIFRPHVHSLNWRQSALFLFLVRLRIQPEAGSALEFKVRREEGDRTPCSSYYCSPFN